MAEQGGRPGLESLHAELKTAFIQISFDRVENDMEWRTVYEWCKCCIENGRVVRRFFFIIGLLDLEIILQRLLLMTFRYEGD